MIDGLRKAPTQTFAPRKRLFGESSAEVEELKTSYPRLASKLSNCLVHSSSTDSPKNKTLEKNRRRLPRSTFSIDKMHKVLLFLTLFSLVVSQDIAPLVAQLPLCFVSLCPLHRPSDQFINSQTSRQTPCFATIIQNACGNPDDWKCACNSNTVSSLNSACVASVYGCTIPEGQGTAEQPSDFPPLLDFRVFVPFLRSPDSSDFITH